MTDFKTITFSNRTLTVPRHCEIPVIPGDGVGKEIWEVTEHVIDVVLKHAYKGLKSIQWRRCLAGLDAYEQTGEYLPSETLDCIKTHLVALKGPLMTPVGKGIRSLNVYLRKEFDLYACVRPIIYFQGLVSPVTHPSDVDMVIFRENTEDIYAGIEWDYTDPKCRQLKDFLVQTLGSNAIPFDETASIGIKPISKQGTQRLVAAAIRYALKTGRSHVSLVHKGNIMKFTEGRFRDWGYECARQQFGDQVVCYSDVQEQMKTRGYSFMDMIADLNSQGKVFISDIIADNFFQQALLNPSQFSVVACPNLNGDFVSDALAAQVGGLGLAPGANINYENGYAIFEATHGTAPDIVGQGKANPTAMLLSAYLLFVYLKWDDAATLLMSSLKALFRDGYVTSDLYTTGDRHVLTTDSFGEQLCRHIQSN